MITFWNRKEIYVGRSMAQCGNIRSILGMNGIKYSCKTVSSHNSRMQPGMWGGIRDGFGEKAEMRYMYYIYVHKTDYDMACKLIADSGNR